VRRSARNSSNNSSSSTATPPPATTNNNNDNNDDATYNTDSNDNSHNNNNNNNKSNNNNNRKQNLLPLGDGGGGEKSGSGTRLSRTRPSCGASGWRYHVRWRKRLTMAPVLRRLLQNRDLSGTGLSSLALPLATVPPAFGIRVIRNSP